MSFVPNVFICVCILHKMLGSKNEYHIQWLMQIIDLESQANPQLQGDFQLVHPMHLIDIELTQYGMEGQE